MSKIIAGLLSVIFLFVFVSRAGAEVRIEGDKLAQIDAYVKEQFELGGFPGGSYAIVHKDQIVLAEGIGYADRKTKRQATADTVYPSASVTKALTASAVLLLAEQGKIDLNAPVQRYLSWFRYSDEGQSAKVTVKHLLTHSAGINRYTADGSIYKDIGKNRNSIENAVRGLRSVKMNATPGSVGQYCNTCYNTLGLVIEAVSGEPYETYMEQQLFQPLGMEHTVFDVSRMGEDQVAKEYGYLFGFSTEAAPYWKAFGKSQNPEGGAYTTAVDLAKFLSAALGYGNPALPISEAIDVNTKFGVKASDRDGVIYTAAGFEEEMISGTTVYSKSGEGMGSSSNIVLIPSLDTGIVLLIGETNGERRTALTEGMIHLLLDEQPESIGGVPNFLQILGYIALGFLFASIVLLIWLVENFLKMRRTNYEIKRRVWLQVRMCLSAIFSVPLWYLIVVVRPTEAGFYGYPYDLFIGLLSLAIVFTLVSVYTALMLFIERRSRRINSTSEESPVL